MPTGTQNGRGGNLDRSKTDASGKGTISGHDTSDVNRLDYQAESLLNEMVNLGDGEYFCQCARCGSTMDVVVIGGRPRDARVTTDGEALYHGGVVVECSGRLRVFGAGS